MGRWTPTDDCSLSIKTLVLSLQCLGRLESYLLVSELSSVFEDNLKESKTEWKTRAE